jgi:hypothetical protein
MDKWQSGYFKGGLILVAPAVPFFPGGVRGAATGTCMRIFGYVMSAYSARLHKPSGYFLAKARNFGNLPSANGKKVYKS